MSRAPLNYAERRAFTAQSGIDVTTPTEGFYRTKLRGGGVYVGVRIWFGPPLDPVTGEEMDRSWRWQAVVNGEAAELDDVWPVCAGDAITEQEYRRFVARQGWAREHAPDSAYAEPRRRIDLLSTDTPLPF